MTVFLTETSASTVDARDFLQTAHGLVQNRGTDYRFYLSNQPAGFPPPPDVNLPLGGWGKAPVQAEGVRCELLLPFPASRVRMFALDPQGRRSTEIAVATENGQARFQVTEAYQTIWYEVVIEREVSTGRNRRRCST